MVEFSQYYEYLYTAEHTADAVQDSNGRWSQAASAWALAGRCRDEGNGAGSRIATEDGSFRSYSSLVQLPKGTTRIAEGTEVITSKKELAIDLLDEQYIKDQIEQGTVVSHATVIRYDSGRLHDRMWI